MYDKTKIIFPWISFFGHLLSAIVFQMAGFNWKATSKNIPRDVLACSLSNR